MKKAKLNIPLKQASNTLQSTINSVKIIGFAEYLKFQITNNNNMPPPTVNKAIIDPEFQG